MLLESQAEIFLQEPLMGVTLDLAGCPFKQSLGQEMCPHGDLCPCGSPCVSAKAGGL